MEVFKIVTKMVWEKKSIMNSLILAVSFSKKI
jgi:hypothetical protein